MPACLFKVPLPRNTRQSQTIALLFKIVCPVSKVHCPFFCSTRTKPTHGNGSAHKPVYLCVGLTGSSSRGAFPERVLEGNFSQVLSHLLSLFCLKGSFVTRQLKTKRHPKMQLKRLEWGKWEQEVRIPRRSSRRWGLALSMGVSPYLLQTLTWAPLVTRSWVKGQVDFGATLKAHCGGIYA